MTDGKYLLCPNLEDENLIDGAEFEPFTLEQMSTESEQKGYINGKRGFVTEFSGEIKV